MARPTRHGDVHLAISAHGNGVRVSAGVVLQDRAGGKRGLDAVAGLIGSGIVQRDKEQPFPGVGLAVVVAVVVALEGEKVAIGPTGPFPATGKLVVDVDEVGNRTHAVIAEGTVVPLAHPGDPILLLVLVIGQIVAGEVDDGRADPGQDVGVGQLQLAGRILVVAMGENHTLLGAESGRNIVQGGQIAAVERGHDHLGLAREVEVAGLDAPVGVTGIAPVVRFANRADKELGVNQRIVPPDVIGIHVVERIGVREVSPLVEVFLNVVDQGLVLGGLALAGETEVFLADVFGGVETDAIVVHGVAEPVDPTRDELAGVLGYITGRVEVRIFLRIPRVADKGSGVGGIVGCIGSLETAVELQDDVHQTDQLLMKRATVAVIG